MLPSAIGCSAQNLSGDAGSLARAETRATQLAANGVSGQGAHSSLLWGPHASLQHMQRWPS